MRAYVLHDPALEKQAGRFVWLSMDGEQEKNHGFFEKYPVQNWPTLLVLDENGAPVLRWVGTASVEQLQRLLDDASIDLVGNDRLVRADREAAQKPAEAARAYRTALATTSNLRRARVAEQLVLALLILAPQSESGWANCFDTAREWIGKIDHGPSWANVAMYGLTCAREGKLTDRRAAVEELAKVLEEAVKMPGAVPADRSDQYEELVETRKALGDQAGAKKLAAAWLAAVEAEAARAKTPEARAPFDPERLKAALALGEPARAIPALQASERDLPTDYNGPARLAIAYRALGRSDAALAAVDRALALAYGPRRLRILELRADLLLERKDPAGARATLERALAIARELPPEKREREAAKLTKKLESIR